ncbi:MAG: hypothetical protein KF847_05190 [Pirellulales bacterium]|nr:hypothetical protein [Pirellulales bacterium]
MSRGSLRRATNRSLGGRPLRFESLERRTLLSADFGGQLVGFALDAAIEGRVYEMTPTAQVAAGIAGVEMRLLDEVGAPVTSTFTDSAGRYTFAGLAPGLYAIQQIQPAGYHDGPESIGDGGGQIVTNDLVGEISLAVSQRVSGYNFAEYAPQNAPAPTIDGLPRLILAGGGVNGPAIAILAPTDAQFGTASSPIGFELTPIRPARTSIAAQGADERDADDRRDHVDELPLRQLPDEPLRRDANVEDANPWDAALESLGGQFDFAEADFREANREFSEAVVRADLAPPAVRARATDVAARSKPAAEESRAIPPHTPAPSAPPADAPVVRQAARPGSGETAA